jgi:hypothetical protein
MSRSYKLLLVVLLALFALACGLIPNPLNEVEDAASTVEALASEIPLETIVPVETLEALPSAIPDIGSYFDPSGTPVEQWNGIPVMPQATVGEEFGDTTYGFTVPASVEDIETFYTQEMEALGWSTTFSLPVTDEGGALLFQNESEFLTITITPDQNDPDSYDVILQK